MPGQETSGFMECVGAVREPYDAETFVRVGTDPGFERSIAFSNMFLRNLLEDRDVGPKRLDLRALFGITHGTVPGDYSHASKLLDSGSAQRPCMPRTLDSSCPLCCLWASNLPKVS